MSSLRVLISSLPKEFPLTNDDASVEWVVIDSVGPLLVSLLNEVLKVGANMILLGQASVKLTSKVIRLCKLLLRTGCRVMFVYSSCGVMHHISDYYKKILSGKNLVVLFNTVANLLGDCVVSLTDLAFTKEGLKLHIENFAETRTAMINTLMLLSKTFGASNELFLKIFDKFVNAITVIMKKDSGLLENITVLKKVQDLPYVASQFVTSFFNNKFLTETLFLMLQRNISGKYQEDSSQLLAALGLLLLFVRYRRYVSVESLKSALNTAESAVVSYHTQISKDADMETDETILEKMVEVLKEARTELTNPQTETEQDMEEEQDANQQESVKQKKCAKPDSPINKNNNQNVEDSDEVSGTGRKRRIRKNRILKKNVQVVNENETESTNPQNELQPTDVHMEEVQNSQAQNECETPDSSFHKISEDENETNSSGRKSKTRKRRVFEKTVKVLMAARSEVTNGLMEIEHTAEPANLQVEGEQEIDRTDNVKQKECEFPDTPVSKTPEDPDGTSSSGRKSRTIKKRVFEQRVEVVREARIEKKKARKEVEMDSEQTNIQVEEEQESEPPDSMKQKGCETPESAAIKTPKDPSEPSSSGGKSRTSKRRVFEKTGEAQKESRSDKSNVQKDIGKDAEPTNKQMEGEKEVELPNSVKEKECRRTDLPLSKRPENETSSSGRKLRTTKRRFTENTLEVVKAGHTGMANARKEMKDTETANTKMTDEQEVESRGTVKLKEREPSDRPRNKNSNQNPEKADGTSRNRRKSRTSKM